MKTVELYNGDCLEIMRSAPDNSIDAVVTDPPYGLSFMGKKWDYDVPSVEIWKEVFRVLKPGGHLLAFGGTRTYHRLAVNVEDAGFEIRDQIQWLYGQGFPKSLDVSKAMEKAGHGATSKQWSGYGTALKPANEPIVLARKPLEKGLTVAQNVQKWGTGALNIDATRIGISESDPNHRPGVNHQDNDPNSIFGVGNKRRGSLGTGRFPANVILDEEAAKALDEQSGKLRARGNKTPKDHGGKYNASSYEFGGRESGWAGDSGGASRFFYCAKASTSERNAGLEEMPEKRCGMMEDDNYPIKTGSGNLRNTKRQNFHPTVKPVKLMEYLCRLITPPGGIVLDPFMGSGTTGIAAGNEGFNFIGIEMNKEYHTIAEARINGTKEKEPVARPISG